jgi:hypothetical protein
MAVKPGEGLKPQRLLTKSNMFIDHFHPYVDDGTGQQKLNLTNKTLGPPDARTLTALATKS